MRPPIKVMFSEVSWKSIKFLARFSETTRAIAVMNYRGVLLNLIVIF